MIQKTTIYQLADKSSPAELKAEELDVLIQQDLTQLKEDYLVALARLVDV